MHDLAELARPTLERIGELTDETVNLAVARGNELIEIAQVDSRYVLGARNWVGVAVPPYCTRAGQGAVRLRRAPAAAGEPRTPHRALPGRHRTARHMLVEVRRRGWAASIDELEVGLAAVAAPIRAVDGAVVAAVSVSGPTARINDRGITALGELLVAELRGLSAQLGAHAGVSPSPDRAKPRR